jgi:ribosomal protein L37AE/L43A
MNNILSFLIFIVIASFILTKLLKNINKCQCPSCGELEFENATHHKIGKCTSCGYQEDITQFEKRLKETQKYV